LRVDSPALARDEEDLALAKNSYSAACMSYKQRRDQYRAQKMALNLARKQHKMAQKKLEEEAKEASGIVVAEEDVVMKASGEPVPEKSMSISMSVDKKRMEEEKKKKKKEKKEKKKKSGSEESDGSSSDSSSESSSSSASSHSSASHSSKSSHSESGHASGESDDDSTCDSSSDCADLLEFGPDGELLTHEAAINAKHDRAQFRLEVHSLQVMKHHARGVVKRKRKALRRHYKCERAQNGRLIKIDKKRKKIEERRQEKITRLAHHHEHHAHAHEHGHVHNHHDHTLLNQAIPMAIPSSSSPTANYEVITSVTAVFSPAPVDHIGADTIIIDPPQSPSSQ